MDAAAKLKQLVDTAETPVRIGKVDVDTMPELVSRYGVMGIPTLLMVSNGSVVDRQVGVPPLNQLLDMIEVA